MVYRELLGEGIDHLQPTQAGLMNVYIARNDRYLNMIVIVLHFMCNKCIILLNVLVYV